MTSSTSLSSEYLKECRTREASRQEWKWNTIWKFYSFLMQHSHSSASRRSHPPILRIGGNHDTLAMYETLLEYASPPFISRALFQTWWKDICHNRISFHHGDSTNTTNECLRLCHWHGVGISKAFAVPSPTKQKQKMNNDQIDGRQLCYMLHLVSCDGPTSVEDFLRIGFRYYSSVSNYDNCVTMKALPMRHITSLWNPLLRYPRSHHTYVVEVLEDVGIELGCQDPESSLGGGGRKLSFEEQRITLERFEKILQDDRIVGLLGSQQTMSCVRSNNGRCFSNIRQFEDM